MNLPTPPLAPQSVLLAPSLYRRMACCLYEAMLLFGVMFVATYLFSALSQQRSGLDRRGLLQVFLFVVFGIYFAWFWSKGQTLAMKTWHIRVVDTQGQPVTQARALWRYVLSWVWVLPPLAVMSNFDLPPAEVLVLLVGWVVIWALLSRFQPQGQFWHDQLAGTRLIDLRPSAAKTLP